MSELGIFHHPTLAASAAAYRQQFANGPAFEDWITRFSPAAHGDFARWQTALAALPKPPADMLTATQNEQLRQALQAFMPWRKGPFQLFDTRINTEWRSDWKWQRLAPHLPQLTGQSILDVGCGNGYFGWQLLAAGAKRVLGVDPTLLFCMQHLAINRYRRSDATWVLPLKFEELPVMQFDGALSLGVVYHRRDAQAHVDGLYQQLKPGGWVVLESLVVQHPPSLQPAAKPKDAPGHRYARMRNVWWVPTPDQLMAWLSQAGFTQVRVVDVCITSTQEQRPTPWMTFESLTHTLQPQDPTRTVEGYPAPCRAMVIARRPLS